jgi:hypothetical protein
METLNYVLGLLKRHLRPAAFSSLAQSIYLLLRGRVQVDGKSTRYLGLPLYISSNWTTRFTGDGKIRCEKNGFLVCGTERSIHRDSKSPGVLWIQDGGELVCSGYNEIGAGSSVWVGPNGRFKLCGDGALQ